MENPVERRKARVLALLAEPGHGFRDEAEVFGDFGAGEAEEEGVVVGDNFSNAFEAYAFVSQAG